MAFGQNIHLVRNSDGKPILINDQGHLYVVIASGDIQIGVVEIKDSITNDRVNLRSLPSGDMALVTIPGEVAPLHSSQMNASTRLQYNASGDLIFIDKVVGNTLYRRSTWRASYTGNQTIDNNKTWTFGGWEIV